MARTKQAGTAHDSGAAALQAARFAHTLPAGPRSRRRDHDAWRYEVRGALEPTMGRCTMRGGSASGAAGRAWRETACALGLSGVGGKRRALREPSVRLIHQLASWRGVQRVAGSA